LISSFPSFCLSCFPFTQSLYPSFFSAFCTFYFCLFFVLYSFLYELIVFKQDVGNVQTK
jgi:hypothetical protein